MSNSHHHHCARGVISRLTLVVLTASCSSIDYNVIDQHVLACNHTGVPFRIDPDTLERTEVKAADRVKRLLLTAEARFAEDEADARATKPQRRKILIHIHGGLNSESASLAAASKIAARMAQPWEDSENRHFPIFVSWQSGLLSSYWEQLTDLRQGRHSSTWFEVVFGYISAPVFLVSDLLYGIVRAPKTWSFQLGSDLELAASIAFEAPLFPARKNAASAFQANDAGYKRYDLKLGSYHRNPLVHAGRLAWYLVTLAPTLLVTSTFVDGPGQSAWEGMLHRAANLTFTEMSFDIRKAGDKQATLIEEPNGAFSVLMRELAAHIGKSEHRERYDVTLVGHSMGAIIINDALRLVSADKTSDGYLRDLPIRDIVYMAPACSIVDAAHSVVPYLQQHQKARFHLLTLHPIAESDERNAYGLAPRGSLLDWIDTYYTRPASQLDRRLGKWVNVMQTLSVFRDVIAQINIKAFSVDRDTIPQMHGDFNDCPFWRRSFWRADGPMMHPPNWATHEQEYWDARPIRSDNKDAVRTN